MWIFYAFASAFFAGLTSILAKIGIKNTDSHVATAIRTVVILIFAWLMVFIVGTQNTILDISSKTLIFLILSGFATGASWLCYFKALQIGDVNKVVPIDKSSTILTMLLAFVLLNEAITLNMILGIFAIGIGTYMMIQKTKSTNIDVKNNKWIIYAILAAIFASLTSILGKIGIENIDSTLGTAIRTIVVLIMAWLIVFITNKQNELKNIDKKSWIFIILSGFATGFSWLFYYRALQEGRASIVTPIDKLSILVSVIFSYFILNEKLTRKSIIGLTLIVGGTLILLIKF